MMIDLGSWVWCNRVRLFTHKKTGGEVMSVSVADENKVFGITFRTPPADSTGVPHILEHSVHPPPTDIAHPTPPARACHPSQSRARGGASRRCEARGSMRGCRGGGGGGAGLLELRGRRG